MTRDESGTKVSVRKLFRTDLVNAARSPSIQNNQVRINSKFSCSSILKYIFHSEQARKTRLISANEITCENTWIMFDMCIFLWANLAFCSGIGTQVAPDEEARVSKLGFTFSIVET